MTLRSLGFFSEFDRDRSERPSMRDAIRDVAEDDERGVVAYLELGYPILDVMTRTPDVIDGSEAEASGSLLTDGSWVWREDLPHYVRKYHLSLPSAFLAHVKTANFQMPIILESELARLASDAVDAWRR